MESTAKDIVAILDGESSLGLTMGIDLFYSRMPSKPSDCVTVYDTPGGPPLLTYRKSTSSYYYSGISVMVRRSKYDDSYTLMFQILEYLHAQRNITVGATYYALIRAVNDPQLLHYDENDRAVIFVNFDVQRK